MTKRKQFANKIPDTQAFSTLQRTLHAITNDIFSILPRSNLTSSQFRVLEAIHREGPLCQRDLADKILKTTGNVTTVIDNLEKQGLAECIRGKKDRRFFEVVLTPAGSSLIKKLYRLYAQQIEKVMNRVTEEVMRKMVRIRHKLANEKQLQH